jgi:hypothetical protein
MGRSERKHSRNVNSRSFSTVIVVTLLPIWWPAGPVPFWRIHFRTNK